MDVTAYVNEHDPWHPLRSMLLPADPDGMRATWAALEAEWDATIARVEAPPGRQRHESVAGEWSFVQTLRHLVFAMDKWCTAPILGDGFDPIGLPNSGSVDFPWPDLEPDRSPSFAEALAVRADRTARFDAFLSTLTPADLDRSIEVLENGTNPVRDCVHTVFEEEFWHLRYARRDLDALAART